MLKNIYAGKSKKSLATRTKIFIDFFVPVFHNSEDAAQQSSQQPVSQMPLELEQLISKVETVCSDMVSSHNFSHI